MQGVHAVEPMSWTQQLGPPPQLPGCSRSYGAAAVERQVHQQGLGACSASAHQLPHQQLAHSMVPQDSAAQGSAGQSQGQAPCTQARPAAAPWLQMAQQPAAGAPSLRPVRSASPQPALAATVPSSWHMALQAQQQLAAAYAADAAGLPRSASVPAPLTRPGAVGAVVHPALAAQHSVPLPASRQEQPLMALMEAPEGPSARGRAIASALNLPAELLDDELLDLLMWCDQ